MRAGAGEIDMAHALASNLDQGHFNAALLADNAAMLQSLVFFAKAFVVLDRAKYLGTEQTIALRLKGTVINRLWFFHFTK